MRRSTCDCPGCTQPVNGGRYCFTHQRRLRLYGQLYADVPISTPVWRAVPEVKRWPRPPAAPLICMCPTTRPDPVCRRQCSRCKRPIAALSERLRDAAYQRWPALRDQRVLA